MWRAELAIEIPAKSFLCKRRGHREEDSSERNCEWNTSLLGVLHHGAKLIAGRETIASSDHSSVGRGPVQVAR